VRHLAETKTESAQLDKLDRVVDSAGKIAVLLAAVTFVWEVVIPGFKAILHI